jgi:hypothetical protein
MLKMAFRKIGEESTIGYEKHRPTDDFSDSDVDEYDDEDAFYHNYQPEVEEFDTGEYILFDPVQEERGYMDALASRKSGTVRKPFSWLNSPEKETITRKSSENIPTWWEKTTPTISDSNRVVNGVLNYAALLPPPTPKPKPVYSSKKNKKQVCETRSTEISSTRANNRHVGANCEGRANEQCTRLCSSIYMKNKCFRGTSCRFAHEYQDLRECNFGVRCKKIVVVKTNPDGTFEMVNKSLPDCDASTERKQCNFKHFNESRDSYLKRVPYTAPHIRASRDKESVNRQNDSSGNRQTGRPATKGRNQNRRK